MGKFIENLRRIIVALFRLAPSEGASEGVEDTAGADKAVPTTEEVGTVSETTNQALDFSWMPIAEAEVGVKEVAGIEHHPRILEYHATTTLRATEDEVPWCSSFVNWVFEQASYTGTRSARALSWSTWGQQLIEPVPGCLVVTKRKGGGHVGFFIREDAEFIWLLGGNQNNEVRVSMFRKRTRPIVAYVLPKHMNDDDLGLYETLSRMA